MLLFSTEPLVSQFAIQKVKDQDISTRCNNDLLINKISSTCFGQYFAHHQERETEIFYSIWYPVVVVGRDTVSGSVARLTLLMMGKILLETC